MLEVDLLYPRALHDAHNALPLAPESASFAASPTTHALQAQLGLKADSLPKLIPNLRDKVKYKVHYRALQQMLELGMVLVRVHRVLEFTQHPILKGYIDFNTLQRAKAANDFEKSLYKLANNAIYGKTTENVENHITVWILDSIYPTKQPSLRRRGSARCTMRGCPAPLASASSPMVSLRTSCRTPVCGTTAQSLWAPPFWTFPRRSCTIFTTATCSSSMAWQRACSLQTLTR
jgi:hypothetical protein